MSKHYSCSCGEVYENTLCLPDFGTNFSAGSSMYLLRNPRSENTNIKSLVLVHGYLSNVQSVGDKYFENFLEVLAGSNWLGAVYGFSWDSLGIDTLITQVLWGALTPIALLRKLNVFSWPLALLNAYSNIVRHWESAKLNAKVASNFLPSLLVQEFCGHKSRPKISFLAHSLGAKLVLDAMSMHDKSKSLFDIDNLILCGAACGNDYDFANILNNIEGSIFNFFNSSDYVLGKIFAAAESCVPLGISPLTIGSNRVINIDCEGCGHSYLKYISKFSNNLIFMN
ncbi:DUF726 domain-containing protein [Fundidesulfovibrio soli]|uniref:DUF726 domain-containing protein n=1 Tax=Fundidesulfovibrio soli TaxID=2922716 RepID=UPI001FB04832|nr:DUF726 domain-containing protein [Fundidesulfovibrio soli]